MPDKVEIFGRYDHAFAYMVKSFVWVVLAMRPDV